MSKHTITTSCEKLGFLKVTCGLMAEWIPRTELSFMKYYHRLEKGTYDNSIKLIGLIFQAFFSCYYDCTLLDTNFINIITSFPKNHEKNNDNLTCPLNFHIDYNHFSRN